MELFYNVEVGNSNPEDTSYYIKLTENNDVYIVDKSGTMYCRESSSPAVCSATLGIDTW